jgi:hypothetical protein
MLEEELCRPIHDRPTRHVFSPDDPHQLTLAQRTQNTGRLDATNLFDLRSHERLLVGNNGEGFERGAREFLRRLGFIHPFQPGPVLLLRHQPIPACDLHNLNTSPVLIQVVREDFQRLNHFGS